MLPAFQRDGFPGTRDRSPDGAWFNEIASSLPGMELFYIHGSGCDQIAENPRAYAIGFPNAILEEVDFLNARCDSWHQVYKLSHPSSTSVQVGLPEQGFFTTIKF